MLTLTKITTEATPQKITNAETDDQILMMWSAQKSESTQNSDIPGKRP